MHLATYGQTGKTFARLGSCGYCNPRCKWIRRRNWNTKGTGNECCGQSTMRVFFLWRNNFCAYTIHFDWVTIIILYPESQISCVTLGLHVSQKWGRASEIKPLANSVTISTAKLPSSTALHTFQEHCHTLSKNDRTEVCLYICHFLHNSMGRI